MRIEPLIRQLSDLRTRLSDLTDIILGRVGDPDWNYTYDIRSKSLVPTTKKVTVTSSTEEKEK